MYSGEEIGRKVIHVATALRSSSGRICLNLFVYELDLITALRVVILLNLFSS